MAGSAGWAWSSSSVVAILVLIRWRHQAADPRRDDHTDPDPEAGDDGDRHEVDRDLDQHGGHSPSRGSAVAGKEPVATRTDSPVPGGASAGPRTIAPSAVRRAMA